MDCPEWEYSNVPDSAVVLGDAVRALLEALRRGDFDMLREGTDSRPVHARLFSALVPAGFEYYAGNYRGSAFPCLAGYGVGIEDDRLVGAHPGEVAAAMGDLTESIVRAVAVLDHLLDPGSAGHSAPEHLLDAVVVAARLFQDFLTIHPYANGNGHTARFLVWLLLARFGHEPTRWTIDPRPAYPNYAAAIAAHRRGDPWELERLILNSLA